MARLPIFAWIGWKRRRHQSISDNRCRVISLSEIFTFISMIIYRHTYILICIYIYMYVGIWFIIRSSCESAFSSWVPFKIRTQVRFISTQRDQDRIALFCLIPQKRVTNCSKVSYTWPLKYGFGQKVISLKHMVCVCPCVCLESRRLLSGICAKQ